MTSTMVSRAPRPSSLADVVDLILDKGLVIDAYIRVSLVGIEILTVDARIVVASVDTYLRFAEAVGRLELGQSSSEGLPELFGKDREHEGDESGNGQGEEGQGEEGQGGHDRGRDHGRGRRPQRRELEPARSSGSGRGERRDRDDEGDDESDDDRGLVDRITNRGRWG